MKISAVIAEFNPLHSGHIHLLNEAVCNGATHIAAIMSGNFVQRGDCSIYSKWDRAVEAVKNGVDIVFEIPTVKAVSSASNFADAGIEIANKTGCIDELFFGSECGDIEKIRHIVNILSDERYKNAFEKNYSIGLSYPLARQKAFEDIGEYEYSAILNNPNDILAIEYLNALKKSNSSIKPVCFKRIGNAHNSSTDGNFMSSMAIRERILNNTIDNKFTVHSLKNCEKAILYKLRETSTQQLKNVPDVNEGLENRIKQAVNDSTDVNEIIEKIKSKRYTHSRLRRIMLCTFLGVTKNDLYSEIPYIKVLAFNEKGREILKIMKETSSVPVILKHADVYNLKNSFCEKYYEKEIVFSDLYALTSEETEPCAREQKSNAIFLKNIDKQSNM